MTNFLSVLGEADEASLRLERARRELEIAKQNLDSAKQAYDTVIAKADEMGLPRAKLKRLTEERLAALIDTGLANLPNQLASPGRAVELKAERPKKAAKPKAAFTAAEEEALDAATASETPAE